MEVFFSSSGEDFLRSRKVFRGRKKKRKKREVREEKKTRILFIFSFLGSKCFEVVILVFIKTVKKVAKFHKEQIKRNLVESGILIIRLN